MMRVRIDDLIEAFAAHLADDPGTSPRTAEFYAVVEDLPEDYHSGVCSSIADPEECVDLFRVSTHHSPVFVSESSKLHLIVTKDELSGSTVAMGYASRSTNFDEFAPEAQKVIDTVKWGGS